MKTCSKCRNNLETSMFYKNRTAPDGLHNQCKTCRLSYSQEFYMNNKESISILAKKRYFDDLENRREKVKFYYAALPDDEKRRRREYVKKWHSENPKKVAILRKRWNKKNKHKVRIKGFERRIVAKTATPGWADSWIIEEIYSLAVERSEATGIMFNVDHIVPLKSKFVCGLHCEHNLQVITAVENSRKGNRHWPDMP